MNLDISEKFKENFLADLHMADKAIRENVECFSHDNTEKWDIDSLLAISKKLEEAESKSKLKSKAIVINHLRDFPLSPLFSDCTLLSPLGMNRKETAITQVLAWLLSPNEAHGFGASLLFAFINALPEFEEKEDLLQDVNSHQAEVYSEYIIKDVGRIDVYIRVNDTVIVVEAKIDTSEGKGQTIRYKNYFDNHRSYKPIYVYLTVDSAKPSSDGFLIVNYLQIVKKFIRALNPLTQAAGFNYASLFITGLLRDFCDIKPSTNIDIIIKSNSFKLEELISIEDKNIK